MGVSSFVSEHEAEKYSETNDKTDFIIKWQL